MRHRGRVLRTIVASASMTAILIGGLVPVALAASEQTVRIGLATASWYPSIVARAAKQQGFFADEGVSAEITVYQSGAEAFTSLASGSEHVISTSPNIIASGRREGVESRVFLQIASNNQGWNLMVSPESDINGPKALDGQNVGITSAGSLSDALAQWTMEEYGIEFTTIPLGGGLVPNLIQGNVDAVVLYSPLSFRVMQDGDGRAILSYGEEMPEHLNSGWAAMDEVMNERQGDIAGAANALLKGVEYLQNNPEAAVRMIQEVTDVSQSVAKQEFENVYMTLSTTGRIDLEDAKVAIELAEIVGDDPLAPADEVYTNEFARD